MRCSSESGCVGGCSGVAPGCAAAAPHDPTMTHSSRDMWRASRMIDLLSPWSRRGESSPTYPIDQGLLGDFEAGGTLSYSANGSSACVPHARIRMSFGREL